MGFFGKMMSGKIIQTGGEKQSSCQARCCSGVSMSAGEVERFGKIIFWGL
jgi:hypothetical protein